MKGITGAQPGCAPAQAIANMGGAPFSVPYSVSINYAGFTGQESGWNWDSSYQGSGTITGTLSQARTSPPSHGFAGLSRREGHASGNMLAAACFRGGGSCQHGHALQQ